MWNLNSFSFEYEKHFGFFSLSANHPKTYVSILDDFHSERKILKITSLGLMNICTKSKCVFLMQLLGTPSRNHSKYSLSFLRHFSYKQISFLQISSRSVLSIEWLLNSSRIAEIWELGALGRNELQFLLIESPGLGRSRTYPHPSWKIPGTMITNPCFDLKHSDSTTQAIL